MRRLHAGRSLLFAALLGWAGACDCGDPVAGFDGGAGDAGPHDGGAVDAGASDAGAVDAGDGDGGALDAGGAPDAGPGDAGEGDAGPSGPDAGDDDGGTAALTCWSCHGSPNNPAPPRDTRGVTARTARTVGAHQAHQGAENWRRTLECSDCHRVPGTIEEPGHIDPSPAELTFGAVANAGNVTSSFGGQSCTTYCHGVTLSGGSTTQPDWAMGPPVDCYQCHGFPPPAPHPADFGYRCPDCHLDVFAQPEKHIDGTLDLKLGCSSCHGDAASSAPPADTQGRTSTALRTVGAHRAHLGPSTWHAQLSCDDCHTVPARYDDPGHLDPAPAELHFGPIASARGGVPTWNGTTCANYCHGQTIAGGTNQAPEWTRVDGTQAACGTCHALPPAAPHPQNPNCATCHGAVVNAAGAFVAPSLHVNGLVEAQVACGSCHALPPATGAHLAHVGAEGGRTYGSLSTAASVTTPTGYAFGCGHCHPLDPARHLNGGRAEVQLYDALAPPGSLKARSPLATYTPGATTFTDDAGLPYTLGTCGSVYCHSGPTYATSSPVPRPGVDFSFAGYPVTYPAYGVTLARGYQAVGWGGAAVGCGGCHGYPVRTSEPGVSAGVGQTHSLVGPGGLESGHAFNHGGTPLNCRACHHDTVTAANSTGRVGGLSTYGPVPIAGFAQHVNGLPDVAFDTINAVTVRGAAKSLAGASYSQPTATCSNVSCHQSQTAVKNGHPFRPDQVNIECNACHQY